MENPTEIKSIYDDGGETLDRYTVVLKNPGELMLALSHNPTSPLGVSLWCSGVDGPHLGRNIKWSELPGHVRKHIIERVKG